MILSCVIAFAVTLIVGRMLIPALRRLKAGQSIREDGPTWHMSKQGTPTMGGLMFIIGIGAAVLIAGLRGMMMGSFVHLYVFVFALVFGIIGYIDDYKFLTLMRFEHLLTPNVYIPFLNVHIHLNWVVYLIFAAFVIVGTVNAVNITDGIDGLVGSVSVPVALFFVCCAFWWGYTQLGIFAAAMLGGLVAFLFYNFHPAKVFMGDTGSLFLGGCVAAMAFAYDMPLILLLVGIIYVVETLSDIIQVTYFKATHGKRLFKMAPLHHHFEMCGWSEVKIVLVFTAVSTVFCALALLGVMDRFAV